MRRRLLGPFALGLLGAVLSLACEPFGASAKDAPGTTSDAGATPTTDATLIEGASDATSPTCAGALCEDFEGEWESRWTREVTPSAEVVADTAHAHGGAVAVTTTLPPTTNTRATAQLRHRFDRDAQVARLSAWMWLDAGAVANPAVVMAIYFVADAEPNETVELQLTAAGLKIYAKGAGVAGNATRVPTKLSQWVHVDIAIDRQNGTADIRLDEQVAISLSGMKSEVVVPRLVEVRLGFDLNPNDTVNVTASFDDVEVALD